MQGKELKKVLIYVHKCLNCYWKTGVDVTWNSTEPLGKCEICGDTTVAKKCSFSMEWVDIITEDENDEDN